MNFSDFLSLLHRWQVIYKFKFVFQNVSNFVFMSFARKHYNENKILCLKKFAKIHFKKCIFHFWQINFALCLLKFYWNVHIDVWILMYIVYIPVWIWNGCIFMYLDRCLPEWIWIFIFVWIMAISVYKRMYMREWTRIYAWMDMDRTPKCIPVWIWMCMLPTWLW